jgi:hypothetical protein
MGSDVEGSSIAITGSCEPVSQTLIHNWSLTDTTVCRNTTGGLAVRFGSGEYQFLSHPSNICTLRYLVCLIHSLFQVVFLVDLYVPAAYPTPQRGARLLPDPLPRVLIAIHDPHRASPLKSGDKILHLIAPFYKFWYYMICSPKFYSMTRYVASLVLLRCVKFV